jgi:hypothetical protein
LPSLANLLYQYREIQQSEEEVKKTRNQQHKQKLAHEALTLECYTVFDFDLHSTSMGTPVSQGAQLTWRPFLGTLLGCCKRVPRQRGETRDA